MDQDSLRDSKLQRAESAIQRIRRSSTIQRSKSFKREPQTAVDKKRDEGPSLSDQIITDITSVAEVPLTRRKRKPIPTDEDYDMDPAVRNLDVENGRHKPDDSSPLLLPSFDEKALNWTQFLDPNTLKFYSEDMEEHYFRTMLLKNRVLILRVLFVIAILLTIFNINIFNTTYGILSWGITLFLLLFLTVLSWARYGAWYIHIATRVPYGKPILKYIEVNPSSHPSITMHIIF